VKKVLLFYGAESGKILVRFARGRGIPLLELKKLSSKCFQGASDHARK